MTLTAKHAQLLKSNRALLLAFEGLPQVAKLSAVGLALTLGVYGGAMALKGTASERVQICIRNKQALRCQDNSGKPYLMTRYHAEQWKADGIPGEVIFQKSIPATNPHKALWMLVSAAGFGIASAGFRSLQNSERQLANYEEIAQKRDLAKGEMSARAELLESLRPVAISEVHLQADLEAVANDRAVVLKQCEVLGEADIKIAAMDAEEAVFDAETAGLSDEKKREYMDFLLAQKTPFLLNGTQTLDSINNPSDKVRDGDGEAIEGDRTQGPKMPNLSKYPSLLIYGVPGAGKSTFTEQEVAKRLKEGHLVIVCDPHAAYGAWEGCEVVGAGMDYEAIDAKLAWFQKKIKERYEVISRQPDPTFQPLTLVAEEFTNLSKRCNNSGSHFQTVNSDIRKAECYSVIVSHTRNLAGLGDAKGMGALRDESMLEVEVLGEYNEQTERATPRFEALVKMPGQSLGDRTLVKLAKHSAPGVEISAPNPSSIAPDNRAYLEKTWGMEFDLSKPEIEPSEPTSEPLNPSTNETFEDAEPTYTPLRLSREQALNLIKSLRGELNQTQIIERLWACKKGGSKAWTDAYAQFKELMGE